MARRERVQRAYRSLAVSRVMVQQVTWQRGAGAVARSPPYVVPYTHEEDERLPF